MTRAKMIMVTVCLTAIGWTASSASADETITMFQWTGGGSPATAWQSDGSWDLPDWPDDALDGATISVGSDLSVNIGSTPVTVAELVLDGTSAGTDIDITADTGGKLLLNNGDDNTYYSAAGGGVDLVPSLNEEGVNHGRVYITSNGVSGSTNTISAPIGLRNNGFLEGVDFFGNTSITLAGDIDIAGYVPPEGTEPEVDEAGMLRSYLPEGTKLLITGNISLDDSVDPSYPRTMSLNNYYTTDHADAPAGTIEISGNISGAGALVIGNTWEYHTEQELYDRAPRVSLPLSTVILSGDNSEFTGDVVLARANTVIRSDTALGSDGTLSMGGEKADKMEVGVRLVADGGDRTISGKNMAITRWLTVMGDNSLTWNGIVYQNNSYGFINLIPHDLQADTGPTLTLAGPVYAARRMEGPPLPGRILTFDGTGKTVITGGIHNWYDDWNGTDPLPDADHSGNVGLLRKRGTGSLVIAYDGEGDSYTDYGGHTFVQGGNLHFATADDLPNPIDCYGLFGQFLSSGGAVGVDDGVLDNTDFLGHLNNSSDPVQNTTTGTFYEYTKGNVIFAIYDDGGLMLGTDEYGTPEEPQSLNFNSGDLANAANMSLAAHETGSTFYGTITPSTTVKVNPNTYMLGGGSGTLIMPTADQLTGSNNLLVANGGEVQLVETNNYTGKTRVVGKYATSLSDDAAFGTADRDLDGDIVGGTGGGDQPGRYRDELQQKPVGTTLTVSHLADGGQDSSIGRSASTATNLVIQGSTLKYVGGAASTDRLFTVGTSGATIDASGSGAVNFTSTGDLAIDTAEDRIAVMEQSASGNNNDNNEVYGIPSINLYGQQVLFSTEDLVPGMAITDTYAYNGTALQLVDDDSPLVITDITGSHVVKVGETDLSEGETPWAGITSASPIYIHTIAFGPAPARMLTLTGSNTGDNTLSPKVKDADDRDEAWDIGGVNTPLGGPGGNGSVGIRKTGAGKWILTNDNVYTGETQVQEGTLIINGDQSAADGLTTVAAGATLGGHGTLGGDLIADGIVAPGTSAGTLSVLGDYTQNEDATLEIEINSASDFDVLAVTGDALFEGNLDVILNFQPSNNDTFTVATAADIINLATLLADLTLTGDSANFDLSASTATSLILTYSGGGLIGDYNGDGIVDAADYTVCRDNYGAETLTNRDPANTGPVGHDDILSWKAHFGEMGGGGSLAVASAVPEPSSLLLAGLALLGLMGVARRHA